MASVSMNGKSCKCDMGKALYGVPAHNFRTKQNHSNKDINPELTQYNKHYGPQSVDEFREKLKSMIEACDSKHPPKRRKKDRKVMLELDIVSPREGMSPEDAERWSAATAAVIYEMFGDQVVGGSYHADEIHEYIDPNDKQRHLSREHTHWSIVPWTDQYGLNMDKFYKRDLPNKINAALDKKCVEMFGYPFRDGSQAKSRGNVEQMKLESTIAEREQVQGQVRYAKDELETVQLFTQEERVRLQEAQEEAKRLAEENGTLKEQNEALQGQNKVLEDKRNEAEHKANNLEQRADAAEQRLARAEGAFSRFMMSVSAWIKEHTGLQRKLRTDWNVSKPHKEKIEARTEETYKRGEKAILAASESLEDLLAAEQEVERGTRVFGALKQAMKEDLDPDELLTDDDFEMR